MSDPVIAHLLNRQPDILEWLNTFLRFKSVGADPGCADDMHATRRFLLDRLTAMGLQDVQLLDGGGQPAVYGAWLGAPGKPTLLVYGHYDVQPADPLELWESPPFEPTVRDGKLFARGSSDVKGSTTIALETVAAFLEVEGACPVNIKFFLEGEEETGSPSLRSIIARYGDVLQADAVISADGGRAHRSVPTINTGARGITKLEITVTTADTDLHSGRYGGGVRNALHEMAALLASLHDAHGTVLVPGFYDDAPALTPEQVADTAAFPFDADAFLEQVGATAAGDPQYTMRERLTLRPALDVNGVWGGYSGPGTKTVIPCEAHAKLSVRVVPGQSPQRALECVKQHLRSHLPEGVSLRVDFEGGASPASSLPPDSPLVQSAQTVLTQEYGQRAIHVRLGATVPITAILKETMGLDTLMFGFNLPDEPVHAPNEFFRLESVEKGLRAWPMLLRELAAYAPEQFRTDASA
jgi:acetylornithine deacetylase/succinyl-diaminopimelate desuccinylase-like protein